MQLFYSSAPKSDRCWGCRSGSRIHSPVRVEKPYPTWNMTLLPLTGVALSLRMRMDLFKTFKPFFEAFHTAGNYIERQCEQNE